MTSSLENTTKYRVGAGICCLLDLDYRRGIISTETCAKAKEFIVEECKVQGWYSGTELYPIEDPTFEDSKVAYYNTENMFDSNTEYGRRRIHLAKLILKEFYHD